MTPGRAVGQRLAGWTALAVGLATLIVGAVLLRDPAIEADVGAVPAAVVAGPPRPHPSRSAAAGRSSQASLPGATPERVVIGALGISAPVDPVAVTNDGSLLIPDDPARLGWWIGSAVPGAARGTVVIAGHVDTAEAGPGALFKLEGVRMGARIKVRTDDREVIYRTVARRSYAKRHLPADLFRAGTAPRLALITCGGTFAHGTYSHNVVLYAVPGP
jgi:hypothetical protein